MSGNAEHSVRAQSRNVLEDVAVAPAVNARGTG
jgi:hypothetical protein